MAAARARFFAGLPDNELTPMEHSLRKALLKAMGSVSGPFPLLEWIDRRIGGEVETRREENGAFEIFLRNGAAPARESAREAFFDSLSPDAFAPPEEALREAVFEFLATWRSPELATMAQLSSYPEVHRRRAAFLPRTVPLKDWIEHRIGGEIEFRGDGRGGSEVVHLTDAARATVMAKFHQMATPMGPPMMPPHHGLPPPPLQTPDGLLPPPPPGLHGGLPVPAPPPVVSKEAWFASLPADELLPGELALREAVLSWLERWPQLRPSNRPAGSNPLIADAGPDPEIRRCRAELLPPKVKLGDWVERRIGGEVELRAAGGGKQEVMLRGAGAAPLPPEGPRSEEAKEAFFASLPEDEFGVEEESLRTALLDFLEQWTGKVAPTLADAGPEEQVSRSRKAVLPKGCPVSLKEWIDRRIGGEIETRAGANGQITFGLRGKLGPPAAAAKRRRTA